MCEATNAQREGFSTSEYYVIKKLKQIISKQIGRVFVSSFASNLSRIEQIIAICVANNRKVCLMGRSMDTNVNVSRKIGYLNVPNETFITPAEIANYPDNEVAILLTGSQGEELAALSQIAYGKHHYVTFKPTDTVILSSNPIPGNYLSVEELVNQIYKCGVKVYENGPNCKIHASGHATQTELQLLIKILRPTNLIPIHGEYKMMASLKNLAELVGMDENAIKVSALGQKLELYDGVVEVTDDFVPIGNTYIDGNQAQDGDHENNDS
ncbi:ribonuclease J [bacterium]|nr:ribonuclease J [bacterium]